MLTLLLIIGPGLIVLAILSVAVRHWRFLPADPPYQKDEHGQ